MDDIIFINVNCDYCGKEHTYKKRFYKIEACDTDKYGLFTVGSKAKSVCFKCVDKMKEERYTLCRWCDDKHPCLVPKDSLIPFQLETKTGITDAVICEKIKDNELKKQELLQIFLKGDVPVCDMDLGGYSDFNTEQGMLSKTPEEIWNFIEKYDEDPFDEHTRCVINYLIGNIPNNTPYCYIHRMEMFCTMVVNNGIKGVISLVENCLTCDMESNAIYGEDITSPNGRDFIKFIEDAYSIHFFDNNSNHCFKLKNNGIDIEDWHLVSEDGKFVCKLYEQ